MKANNIPVKKHRLDLHNSRSSTILPGLICVKTQIELFLTLCSYKLSLTIVWKNTARILPYRYRSFLRYDFFTVSASLGVAVVMPWCLWEVVELLVDLVSVLARPLITLVGILFIWAELTYWTIEHSVSLYRSEELVGWMIEIHLVEDAAEKCKWASKLRTMVAMSWTR